MWQSLQQSGPSSSSPGTSNGQAQVQEQNAHLTPAPKLHVRQDACSKISQSASQAIQQASQQASQSVQQATQQASQSVQQASQQASQASRQASQSASQAIQQAQQSASQSIDAASRTASSVSSSANSVVSSVQASAESAVARANLAMQTAQLSASLAQSEASKAVLAAAPNGPTSGSQLAQPNAATTSSHAGTVTPTQLALSVVGSVIASSLITLIAVLVFLRHKKLSRAARSESLGNGNDSIDDLKLPVSGKITTTIETSQSEYESERNGRSPGPHVSFSLFPKSSSNDSPAEKQTALAGNKTEAKAPTDPLKSPSLRSWLRHQDNVSPFGLIQLPTKQGSQVEGPLGGQLKSQLRGPPPPRFNLDVSSDKKSSTGGSSMPRNNSTSRPLVSPKTMDGIFKQPAIIQSYRESKASEWTDAMTEEGSEMFPSSSQLPASGIQEDAMRIPSPNKPIRNTVEWLMDRETFRAYSPDLNSRSSKQSVDGQGYLRPRFTADLPSSPRGSNLVSRPRPRINQQGDGAQGSNGLLDPKDKSKAKDNQPNTPGVGKAL